ncbi:MAG: elongation factor P [Planctomycetota bacterium]|nr:elongation factor P [Planctomycetota bacterium]
MSIKASELRRGMAVNFKDGIWVCIDNQKVAKGNWRSYQVIQIKNIQTGQLLEDRFRTDEAFEQAMLDRKSMEYLYSDGDSHVVMDPQSYEQTHIPAELIGDKSVYLAPNIQLEVCFVDGQAVTVELPNTVELTVVDTPPQVKGATATSQLKDAVCDGGARIKVPPFVENGQVVKVDTRSGEYLGRA